MLKWNDFASARNGLVDHYVNAWHNELAYARFDRLYQETMDYLDTLAAESRPVQKAKAFTYILENAPLYLNPNDPFGIALEAQKMSTLLDVGSPYEKVLGGFAGRGMELLGEKLHRPEDAAFNKAVTGHAFNEYYIDYNHSTPGWKDIHALGIHGLRVRAQQYRSALHQPTEEQKAMFEGIDITYQALETFFLRAADALEHWQGDAVEQERALYMAQALRRLAVNPPADLYEAMLLSWLVWYLQENIDGIRVRTMGCLDELYRPFYEKTSMSRDEVRDLIAYFMCEFHAFRVHYQEPMYLGGLNEDGTCLVNDLSFLALEAYNLLSAPNPKLQAKINANTPDAFVDAVLQTIRNGNSSISIMNDDNAAASLEKLGVPHNEAIQTLMSGCWDFTVKDHEVKTIPLRVSLPKVLEYTLTDGLCLTTGDRVLPALHQQPETFEDFVKLFEQRFAELFGRAKGIIENWERYLEFISPANMYTATHTDALSRAVDGYARGMKYNTTCCNVAGLATLVDSLCMIGKYVYDQKALTLDELVQTLEQNWNNQPELRRQVLKDADKYGNGSDMADALAVRICKFLGKTINGVPNSRGSKELNTQGYWKLGILSIDKHVRFGKLQKATPDGRLEGEPISKNLASVIGMDRGGVTAFLNSVGKIDFTDAPHAGMVDVMLHPTAVDGEAGMIAFRALVRTYFAKGGHSIQFNIFDAEQLKKAQREPDKYRNLQVRVCGWNVYFVDLEKVLQDAFIAEAEKAEQYGV